MRSSPHVLHDPKKAVDPALLAVVEEDRGVTWSALAGAAERLGTRLDNLGPDARGPCVVHCGRSAEMVAAVLACLQRKRSFVLVDADVPSRRLQWIARDCDAAAVLRRADAPCAALDAGLPQLEIEFDDADDPERSNGEARIAAQAAVDPTGDPERELYRVYTSGSSGRPKAVAVPARSIDGLLPALLRRIPEIATARCIGLTAALGFDAALQQILLSLWTGTPLAVPGEDTVRAVDALMDFWDAASVDVADGTPTLLRMLAAAPGGSGDRIAPRTLLIGGDVLRPSDLAGLWSRFGPEIAVLNLYGVAECGIDATVHRATASDARAAYVPIGTALDHCSVFVADEAGGPVEDGVVGELCIAGTAVGLGYPSDPEGTAARFVRRDGASVYRTGDVGRVLDGALAVSGRRDRQIKLGGRRVDPAELEQLVVEWAREAGRRAIPGPATGVERCSRCVLSAVHPDADLDASGLCRYCRTMTGEIACGWGHFREPSDLAALLGEARRRRTGDYDAVLLFSGGKDSTYALYRLQDLGVELLAYTFDNGFISADAFRNIARILCDTGTEHRVLRARDNPGLLAESLRADATVCTGCFKGITTLGTRLASDVGAPLLVSGLSRGQIIETKLLQFLRRGRTDLSEVDAELDAHLDLYLARRDAQAEAVGDRVATRERVQPVDYFRYDDASSEAVLDLLAERDSAWRAPADTGVCSSNCRANDVGIAEHVERMGFHNYEGPLSWEVRLGMLPREEALAQVEAAPAAENVTMVRVDLARRCDAAFVQDERGRLVGALQAGGIADTAGLDPWLRGRVPTYMLPDRVEVVPELPRLASGKVDYEGVRRLLGGGRTDAEAPVGDDEAQRGVTAAWAAVLGHPPHSPQADFFKEGGDSLAATELAATLERTMGVTIPIATVFESPTPEGIGRAVRGLLADYAGRSAPAGARPSAVALRTVRTADASVGPVTLVLMPDLLGRAGPLVRLFGAVGSELGGAVVAVGFAGAAAWGDEPSIPRLADAIGSEIALSHGPERLWIVGWSFGALLAEHVASALARTPSSTEDGDELPRALLLDPPSAPQAEVERLRSATIAALGEALPQLRLMLRDEMTWLEIAAVLDRARRYRGGERRVLDALPSSARRLVRGGDEQGERLGFALVDMARALAAIAALPSGLSGPSNVPFQRLLVRPSGRRMADGAQDRWSDAAEVHRLEGADHDGMVDVEHVVFYAGLARRSLSIARCEEPLA